jgi:hypothetical protein
MEDDSPTDAPSPSAFPYDPHYGYSPTPSPPPEIANQLTQEQIDMGMIKIEPGSLGQTATGNMGPPPQPVVREESVDAFKGRGVIRRSSASGTINRKRKDRDSDIDDSIVTTGRKKRG